MENTKIARFWSVLNVAAAVLVLVVNSLANSLPINGYTTGEISAFYPNLFVPAGITFSIWGIIYILMIGFVIHGLVASFKQNENTYVKIIAVGPWFVISCLANAGWILAWHYQKLAVSVVLMLLLLVSLIVVYSRLESNPFPRSFPEKLTLRWPFSIYLGWICVATIANVSALLVDLNWDKFGVDDDFWLTLVLSVALIISTLFVIRKRDSAFAWVIVWAFSGIMIKLSADGNTTLTGYYLVLIGMIYMAFLGGITAFKKSKRHSLS